MPVIAYPKFWKNYIKYVRMMENNTCDWSWLVSIHSQPQNLGLKAWLLYCFKYAVLLYYSTLFKLI